MIYLISYSVLDLAQEYFSLFLGKDIYPGEKKINQVVSSLNELLLNGWIDIEIINELKAFWIETSGVEPKDLLVLFNSKKRTSANLINPGEFYYHNQLRLMPAFPTVTVNLETGEIEREVQEFFLEMKASYTIENLLNYYHICLGTEDTKLNHNRFIGIFKWLLKYFSIERLLFMIDALNIKLSHTKMPPPDSPVVLTDYELPGKDLMNKCINEAKIHGGDKVVLRKRLFMDRRSTRTSSVQQRSYDGYF